jgi:hypothetical protein
LRIARSRAPTVFLVRIKAIRTKNTVMVYSKQGAGALYKIADCARMKCHPCAIGDPRGRFCVRAKSQLCNNAARDLIRRV